MLNEYEQHVLIEHLDKAVKRLTQENEALKAAVKAMKEQHDRDMRVIRCLSGWPKA